MARKFLAVIAGIIATMAALAIVPAISNQGSGLSLDYARESVLLMESGEYDTGGRETLSVQDDGSAVYTRFDSRSQQLETRTFTVSSDEMKVLRELFLATGFMEIPGTDYSREKADLANYTRYQLAVQSGEESSSKSIRWVNPEAADGSVPSIIINAGSRLDAIIQRHT